MPKKKPTPPWAISGCLAKLSLLLPGKLAQLELYQVIPFLLWLGEFIPHFQTENSGRRIRVKLPLLNLNWSKPPIHYHALCTMRQNFGRETVGRERKETVVVVHIIVYHHI